MREPSISKLALDPDRIHNINANSFQQNAIITANGWQYTAFYTSGNSKTKSRPLYVNLARRKSPFPDRNDPIKPEWKTIMFTDYEQAIDDGHNTISIGICRGDGTIHVAFDHHCDPLKFRISQPGVATNPLSHNWDVSLFSPTRHTLPGITYHPNFTEVTYPRFLAIGTNLLFSHRIGKAGLGSDVLYTYSSSTHKYTSLGTLLTGVSSSPYINGISHAVSRTHISFCYRHFIDYAGATDPTSTAHKAQAGPNGPENNEGLYYIYSDDDGITWHNTKDDIVARLNGDIRGNYERGDDGIATTVLPSTDGTRIFDIPKNSGILNQESQAADHEGGFHVLNRETRSGVERWIHYYRGPVGNWTKEAVPTPTNPTETGPRGSLAVGRRGNLFAVLQGNQDSTLMVLRARKVANLWEWGTVWTGIGYDGEPLVDVEGLEETGVLSVFTRTDGCKDREGKRHVVVVDFDVEYD